MDPRSTDRRIAHLRGQPTRSAALKTVVTRTLASMTVLLVLPLGTIGGEQYFCRAMQRVMDACCCAKASAAASLSRASCAPELKSGDCCKRLAPSARNAAPAVRGDAVHVPGPGVAAWVPHLSVPKAPNLYSLCERNVQARAPPGVGPPLFLTNCALLT